MEIIKFFTNDLGFNPNYEENESANGMWTTIDVAAYFGHLDVVKFLVNIDIPRNNYDDAIENAEFNGHQDVVDFLKAQRRKRRPPIRYQDHQMSNLKKN